MNLNHIEVNVTQAGIDAGKHKCICSCPIANEINRNLEPPSHYPRLSDASVHLKDGHVTLEERDDQKRLNKIVYKFDLPIEACEFVEDWDAGRQPKPVRFDLELREWGTKSSAYGSI